MVHESKENMNRRDFFRNLAFLSFVTFSTKSLYAKGSKKDLNIKIVQKMVKFVKIVCTLNQKQIPVRLLKDQLIHKVGVIFIESLPNKIILGTDYIFK